jgi:hypothetical protein
LRVVANRWGYKQEGKQCQYREDLIRHCWDIRLVLDRLGYRGKVKWEE